MDSDQPSEFLLVIGNLNYSSWSMRAWLMLRQTGAPFEEVRLPLDTPEFRDKIASFSPSRRVPVLIHGSNTIWDSLAIGEYLAERFPTLWPIDPDARAFARCVSAEMHAGFSGLRRELPMNCRARDRTVALGDEVRADIARITDIWTEARQRFAAGGPWLCGAFSLADCMFAPVASRFLTYGIDVSGPAAAYAQALLGHADVAEWTDRAHTETEVIAREEVGA